MLFLLHAEQQQMLEFAPFVLQTSGISVFEITVFVSDVCFLVQTPVGKITYWYLKEYTSSYFQCPKNHSKRLKMVANLMPFTISFRSIYSNLICFKLLQPSLFQVLRLMDG